ncbi:glycoside hydrolase superfamily, partial [Blyttiomyces helicus]
VLDWDARSLRIRGEPVMILSGEFHYWRVPDRERWESVLRGYKAVGVNTIRIYFSWAYHSPAQGTYHFTANRDIDHLLTLCSQLGLFVLVAPGPYICAETQGGGIPQWVVAKRDVRIRHSVTNFWRRYDPEYSRYSQ